VLAAQFCESKESAPEAKFTPGMPRAGGSPFQASYNANAKGPVTYRLVHGLDVVASIPMSAIGFRHVGRMLQCGADKSLTFPLDCRLWTQTVQNILSVLLTVS